VILADASIWIDFFRSDNPDMKKRLIDEQIAMHPFVVAELALGSLQHREKTLEDLDGLPQVEVAYLDEVRSMIETHKLYSKGIGLTDAHLVASCLMSPGTFLWTRDIQLASVAKTLGIQATLPRPQ
jgi:predicted nucleic acid-binding protein